MYVNIPQSNTHEECYTQWHRVDSYTTKLHWWYGCVPTQLEQAYLTSPVSPVYCCCHGNNMWLQPCHFSFHFLYWTWKFKWLFYRLSEFHCPWDLEICLQSLEFQILAITFMKICIVFDIKLHILQSGDVSTSAGVTSDDYTHTHSLPSVRPCGL